jgi:YD repeat-containing protein
VHYRYENSLLTEVETVTGGVERYTYDQDGRITNVTNADGVTYVHNEYDQKGRVVRQTLCNGQEYILLYNDDDRTNIYLTPGSNRQICYIYNRNRQLVCTKYQDGTTQERKYDDWENIIWEKDRNGNETHRTYDEFGHLLEEEYPNGLIVSYIYDEDGNCLHMWDNNGTDISYHYDKNGNITKETEQLDDSVSRSVTFEYDRYGRVEAFTDANGHKETYLYESGFWESTTFTTAAGNVYRHNLDRAGRCVAVTSADGESTYAYNGLDIMSMATDPMGHTTRYLYNRMTDLIGLVRPNHHVHGEPDIAKETYTNDAFHHRLSRTDCTGAVYAVHRDGEGNIIKEINPNTYNRETDDGEGIIYIYDDYDRAVRVCYPGGGILRRWYDPAGNVIKICSPTQYDKITDNGAGYSYEYDSMGRVVQETAPDRTVLWRYVYDLRGNLLKIISAKGMATGSTDEERTGSLYTYNRLGWLMESRIPVSIQDNEIQYRLTKYKYDKAGNRIQERRFCEYQTKDSEGGIVHTINYTYDADDRLIQVSDCTGAVIEYRYDANNRRIFEKRRINDSAEQIFRYHYDAGGRLIELNRTADKEGCGRGNVSVKYEYDKNGNNIKMILPTGAQILREYDAADRLISERHIDKDCGIDNTTRFAYDKAGNLVSITDNQGRSTQIAYDLMNQEIKRTERDGSVTRQFYDAEGQLIKVIRPNEYQRAGDNGKGLQYTYDARGNILTVIRPDGIIQESNLYDIEGNLIHTHNGTGNGVDMEYDIGGRRTKIMTKGKASQQYVYDAPGNITGITDGAGNHTEYILDKWGRIVEIRQADESSEFYSYDYAGNVICSTDGEGNTTTYEYSNINQLTVLTDPTGEQETYHYDAQERLCKRTDRNGTQTRYAYNIYDNLTERIAKKTDGTELSDRYEYTAEGLLKSAIAQGMRYHYVYDTLGRLTEKKASGRTLLSFQYDLNGNLTHQMDVTGKVTEYRYDLTDSIREVWDNDKKIAEYTYNPDNTINSLSCGSLYTEYTYDTDRNLIGLKTKFGTEVIVENRYTYDGNGNQLEKVQKHGTIKYNYDRMNRLEKVQYPNATEELFYDKAGNRTKRLYNGIEELYQYDKRNRLTTYTKGGVPSQFTYDKAGNLLKDDKAKYTYDAFNRNTKVETFNGNIQINLEPVEINMLIKQIFADMDSQIQESGLYFVT